VCYRVVRRGQTAKWGITAGSLAAPPSDVCMWVAGVVTVVMEALHAQDSRGLTVVVDGGRR